MTPERPLNPGSLALHALQFLDFMEELGFGDLAPDLPPRPPRSARPWEPPPDFADPDALYFQPPPTRFAPVAPPPSRPGAPLVSAAATGAGGPRPVETPALKPSAPPRETPKAPSRSALHATLPPSQRPAPRPAAKASKRELKFDPTVIQIQDPLEPTPLSPAALNFDGKPAAPSFPPPPWVQKAQTLAELETGSRSCAACPLKKTSPGSLFGKGQTKPEFLIVLGLPPLSALRNPVYPSEEEGDLFARIVATGLGQKIEDLYVTPAIKCASAAPASELVPRIRKACARILLKEIELAAPRRILALGTLAAQALKNSSDSLATLMNSKSPFALVGDRQIPLLVTYGLDMALKDPALEGRILEDLTKLRDAPRP